MGADDTALQTDATIVYSILLLIALFAALFYFVCFFFLIFDWAIVSDMKRTVRRIQLRMRLQKKKKIMQIVYLRKMSYC